MSESIRFCLELTAIPHSTPDIRNTSPTGIIPGAVGSGGGGRLRPGKAQGTVRVRAGRPGASPAAGGAWRAVAVPGPAAGSPSVPRQRRLLSRGPAAVGEHRPPPAPPGPASSRLHSGTRSGMMPLLLPGEPGHAASPRPVPGALPSFSHREGLRPPSCPGSCCRSRISPARPGQRPPRHSPPSQGLRPLEMMLI